MVVTDRRRTGVKTVLPKLLLKFSIIVLAVMLTGSAYTYYQVDSKIKSTQTQTIRALASGAVAGLSDMMVIRDYSHIQQTLEQLMANEAIVDVAVTDVTGKILSEVKRTDTKFEPVFADERLDTPADKDDISWTKDSSTNMITLWAKIDSNYHIGWIKIELSTHKEDSLLGNLNATLIMTFIIMVIVLGVLVGSEFKKTYDVLNLHEQTIYHVAHYDTLTKLPNRLSLQPTLQQMISNADKHGTPLAISFLDLDGFKEINDQFGHATGDKVLFQVAMRLKSMLRLDDAVIRAGGDEFVILLNNINPPDVESLLDRIITEINEPYDILVHGDMKHLHLGASIGVTHYPGDTVPPNELLDHADAAMYEAKAQGKNRISVYNPVDTKLVSTNNGLDI